MIQLSNGPGMKIIFCHDLGGFEFCGVESLGRFNIDRDFEFGVKNLGLGFW